MAVVKVKPTSPGRRAVVKVVTSPTCYKGEPHAPLLEPQVAERGRNNTGHITIRHKGGGHKHHYRVVDFRRNKDGIPAKVERIEYDPNRSAHIALLCYADGERRYIIAPRGVTVGDAAACRGPEAPIKRRQRAADRATSRSVRPSTASRCSPARARRSRASGRRLGSADGRATARYAQIRLRSGEVRKVHVDCRATIGEVGNDEHNLRQIGKAGATALARHPPDGSRRGHEPGRPPARRRRRQDGGRYRPASRPWGTLTKGYKTRRNKRTTYDDRAASRSQET
jgi:large subunit ribosomal protein L2